MTTQSELIKERKILAQLGVPPVKVWPARCTWYNQDGSVNGVLPSDPYSRLLYLDRGLRPDIPAVTAVRRVDTAPPMVGTVSPDITVTLLDAVVGLVEELGTVECTATELLNNWKV